MHRTFLYNSLPSLLNYDVKVPYCTFSGGRKQATTNFLSLSKLEYTVPKKLPTFAFSAFWNKREKKIENARIRFNSDVFADVAVVNAKAP